MPDAEHGSPPGADPEAAPDANPEAMPDANPEAMRGPMPEADPYVKPDAAPFPETSVVRKGRFPSMIAPGSAPDSMNRIERMLERCPSCRHSL